MDHQVISIIPARGGSLRLPRKNLLPFHGQPLVAYPIAAARSARLIDRVIVSTDDEAMADVALQYGAEVVRRPDELARADSAIDDAYRHVLAHLETEEGYVPEIVVGMQANVPIQREGEIDAIIQRLKATPWATAIATAKRVGERPEWMKQFRDAATGEIGPLMDASSNYRKQDLPDLYLLDGAVIAMRTEVLKRTAGDRRVHAYLGERVVIEVHAARYAIEIDDTEDVEFAEFFLARELAARRAGPAAGAEQASEAIVDRVHA